MEMFPYTNFHDLNMDWIIKVAKDFLDQYTNIQQTITEGLEDIDAKAEEIQAHLDAWYETHSEDIANELANALAEIAIKLQDAIIDFNAEADAHAQAVIDSIPQTYADLSASVQKLYAALIETGLDLITVPENSTSLVNGVTWTIRGRDSVHAEGTATNNSFVNLYADINNLPTFIQAGGTYYLTYSTTDSNIRLSFVLYKNGDYYTDWHRNADSTITFPSDITGMVIRFLVPNGSVVNGTAGNVGLYKYRSDKQLFDRGIYNRYEIPNGTDINTITQAGTYALNATYTYTNVPTDTNYWGGTLIVFPNVVGLISQVIVQSDGRMFSRSAIGGSFTRPWQPTGSMYGKGTIADGTDLNTITTAGTYGLDWQYSYTNSPLSAGAGGILIVFPASNAGLFWQVCVSATGLSVYQRTCVAGNFNIWHSFGGGGNTYYNNFQTDTYQNTYYITATPSITTDTNSYLAPTGDRTDRRADILAMLAATGVCRLGKGLYVISDGIDLTSGQSIYGTGPSTIIELTTSQTANRHAISMTSNCIVEGLSIRYGAGNYTPGSLNPAPSIYGIMFTADFQGSPSTTASRAIIEKCWVYGFPGAGIYCMETGYNTWNTLIIHDTFMWYCETGLHIGQYCEYYEIDCVNVTGCSFGCINCGGNNTFTNCNFSSNATELCIDNQSGQSPNNSHGTFSACKFNHASPNNTGKAIEVLRAENGEIFNGCQIFYGTIKVDDSVGIRFVGCNLGPATPIEVTNSTVVCFDDCVFYSSSDNGFTHSGNTRFEVNKCYYRNGNLVTIPT